MTCPSIDKIYLVMNQLFSLRLAILFYFSVPLLGENSTEVFRVDRVYSNHPLSGEVAVPFIVAWNTGVVFRFNSATNWSFIKPEVLADRVRKVESELFSREATLKKHPELSWVGYSSFIKVTVGKVVLESWHPLIEAPGDCVLSGSKMYPVKNLSESKRIQDGWTEEYKWFRSYWAKCTNIVETP